MMWRPKDWENPIGDFIPDIGKGQQWAFELGADAMFKALLDSGTCEEIIYEDGRTYRVYSNIFIPVEVKK